MIPAKLILRVECQGCRKVMERSTHTFLGERGAGRVLDAVRDAGWRVVEGKPLSARVVLCPECKKR